MPFPTLKLSKTSIVLGIILVIFIAKDFLSSRNNTASERSYSMMGSSGVTSSKQRSTIGMADLAAPSIMMAPESDSAIAPSNSAERMVVRNTSLSLQVKSVVDTITVISNSVTSAGGFVIDSMVSKPGEVASGNLSFRLPNEKAAAVLAEIKGLAIKVVSETVSGHDVTDQYEDIEARLAALSNTKTKLEKMHTEAASVTELLEVSRELATIQTQIDNLKGHQHYLAEVSKLTRVTIYLSTDDLALPYAPDNSWRPEVVFKQAVRNLVIDFRGIGNGLIWLVVYSPLWGIALISFLIWKKRARKTTTA